VIGDGKVEDEPVMGDMGCEVELRCSLGKARFGWIGCELLWVVDAEHGMSWFNCRFDLVFVRKVARVGMG
jgi:hypothetical protein